MRFLVEQVEIDSAAETGTVQTLSLPAGRSWLAPATDEDAPPHLERGAPPIGKHTVQFEPVNVGGRERVLMSGTGGLGLRVNGLPAPPLAVLSIRDEIRIGPATVLHLTVYRKPDVGSVPPDRVGEKCPTCRTPVSAGDTVYTCLCGQILHLQGEEVPAEERLACARTVKSCPGCSRRIRLTAGYEYLPGR